MSSRHYRSYLEDELALRCRRNPRYSLRSYAKAGGLDVSTLSKVLGRKSHPSAAATEKLIRALKLGGDDASAFRSSAAEERRLAKVARLGGASTESAVGPEYDELSEESFRAIARGARRPRRQRLAAAAGSQMSQTAGTYGDPAL